MFLQVPSIDFNDLYAVLTLHVTIHLEFSLTTMFDKDVNWLTSKKHSKSQIWSKFYVAQREKFIKAGKENLIYVYQILCIVNLNHHENGTYA